MIMFVCSIAPELDASQALLQLDQVGFPHNLWRDLATGLGLGGQTSKFNEGIDYTDKLQRLISYWIDNKDYSWQQLVDAVDNCWQKTRAKQLAKRVGATPPSKFTIYSGNPLLYRTYFRGICESCYCGFRKTCKTQCVPPAHCSCAMMRGNVNWLLSTATAHEQRAENTRTFLQVSLKSQYSQKFKAKFTIKC